MEPQEPIAGLGKGETLSDPLEQIASEHLQQREVCNSLDRLAGLERPDPELAAGLLSYFESLLPRHVHDEEDGLFPLLRRRSEPGDDINDTLDRLVGNHSESLKLAVEVRGIVQAMANDNVLPDAIGVAALVGYAAHERRHLIVENAIVLPLARARLTDDDLAVLRAGMDQRRAEDSVKESG